MQIGYMNKGRGSGRAQEGYRGRVSVVLFPAELTLQSPGTNGDDTWRVPPQPDARPSLGVWMVWGSWSPRYAIDSPRVGCFLSPDPSRRDPEPPP